MGDVDEPSILSNAASRMSAPRASKNRVDPAFFEKNLLQLYTTKLDMAKFTPEQIRQAEMVAAQIERENKSGKVNRKIGEVSLATWVVCDEIVSRAQVEACKASVKDVVQPGR